jgi:hypothetical protein
MALQMTVTTPHGFEATNAYHRVENVSLASKESIRFDVMSYKNAEAAAAFNAQSHLCAYDLSGDNPIKQAYEHLKSLNEFQSASNC